MIAYIARRLILSLFTIVMISMLAFFIIELPEGDLASKRYDRTTAYTSGDAQATEIMEALREYLQLDRPIYVRYATGSGTWSATATWAVRSAPPATASPSRCPSSR